MNTFDLVSEKPVFSWQINELPRTLFDLVGDVQERARGFDFGNLKPQFDFRGTTLVDPQALSVHYQIRTRNIEALPLPSWWNTQDGILWKLHDLPFRISILLSRARYRFPGVSFQMIGVEIDQGDNSFILRDLSPKVVRPAVII